MANSLAGNNNVNSFIGNLSKIKNITPIAEIDRVNVYEFENGMDVELTNLGGELTSENIRKAQSKVLKNLKKDPAYYTNQIAEETIKRFGEYGSGKKKQGKYTNKKDAESVKADGGKAKVKSYDAPYGRNEEVKGKYKSSGMTPLKENAGCTTCMREGEMNEGIDEFARMLIDAGVTNNYHAAQAIVAALGAGAIGGTAMLGAKIAKLISKVKGNKTEAYDIDNASTETDPAEYRAGSMMPEDIDLDEPGAIARSMRQQVTDPTSGHRFFSQKQKEYEEKMKAAERNGKKVKLDKERLKMIGEMVAEAVKAMKEGTIEVGDLNTAKTLARNNTDRNITYKYNDPKNPND